MDLLQVKWLTYSKQYLHPTMELILMLFCRSFMTRRLSTSKQNEI